MTIAIAGPNSWHVTWDPAPDNILLAITISCPDFLATSIYDIAPTASSAFTYRTKGPKGSSCWVEARIVAGEWYDSLESGTITQSTSLRVEES